MESRIYEEGNSSSSSVGSNSYLGDVSEMSDDASTSSEEHISNNTGSTMENNDVDNAILPNTHSGEGSSLQLGGTTPTNQNPLGINGENPQNSSGLELPLKIRVSEKENNPVKVKITKKSGSFGYVEDKNWSQNFGEFDIRSLKLFLQWTNLQTYDIKTVLLRVRIVDFYGKYQQMKHFIRQIPMEENRSDQQNANKQGISTADNPSRNGTMYRNFAGNEFVLFELHVDNNNDEYLVVKFEIRHSEIKSDVKSEEQGQNGKNAAGLANIFRLQLQLFQLDGEELESISNFVNSEAIEQTDFTEIYSVYGCQLYAEKNSGLRRSTNKRESSPEVRKNKKSKTE